MGSFSELFLIWDTMHGRGLVNVMILFYLFSTFFLPLNMANNYSLNVRTLKLSSKPKLSKHLTLALSSSSSPLSSSINSVQPGGGGQWHI